jgi:histidine triad (HIT) family protein
MDQCPFCRLTAGDLDNELIVLQTDLAIAFPALKQRRLNRGHVLVVPRAHVTRLIDMDGPLLQELYSVAGRVSMAVRRAFDASGTTLFQNDNAPDQVLFHVHVHVVPRRADDNFKLPDPTAMELSRDERLQQALTLRAALT